MLQRIYPVHDLNLVKYSLHPMKLPSDANKKRYRRLRHVFDYQERAQAGAFSIRIPAGPEGIAIRASPYAASACEIRHFAGKRRKT